MSIFMPYEIHVRKQISVNTDPQRRCYNGYNFSEETNWTNWGRVVGLPTLEWANESADSYRKLNPSREYKVMYVEKET